MLKTFYSTNNYLLSVPQLEISTLRVMRATYKLCYSLILKDLTVLGGGKIYDLCKWQLKKQCDVV